MSEPIPPKVLKNEQNVQLMYESPHRIHDIAFYPFISPNGSTIIIYGHDNGVRLIWRGGRQFRAQSIAEEHSRINGTKSDDAMVIDSDNEDSNVNTPAFEDKPDFVGEDAHVDQSNQYPQNIQQCDLNFGAAAFHVAVPPTSVFSADVSSAITPAILNNQLLFVLACSDQKLRLITLPPAPPSPLSKSRQDLQSNMTASYAGHGKWGETVVELVTSVLPADGVSMTFTNVEKVYGASGDGPARGAKSHISSAVDWQILIASFSRESSGLLLIHQLPIITTHRDGKTRYSASRSHTIPLQRIALSSPAVSVTFNPNILSPVLSTQLLIADKKGACRIYDCRSSRASPSLSSENLGSGSSIFSHGLWLLTMYPGFLSNKSDAQSMTSGGSYGNFGRKIIVDAKWVMGGRAVIVLLNDGEWGGWDVGIDAVTGSSKSVLGQRSIRGGAMTAFSISGWIDTPLLKYGSSKASVGRTSNQKFVPMTPSTRKSTEPVLFSGRSVHGFVNGKISVTRLHSVSTTSLAEESVAFWLEDSYCMIPNFRNFWDIQTRRSNGSTGNLFGTGNPLSRMIRLEGVTLRGERCHGIAQFPSRHTSKGLFSTEILILGEHRYCVVSENTHQLQDYERRVSPQSDYQLPLSRDLEVAEIDEILSRMENSDSLTPIKSKRVVDFLD